MWKICRSEPRNLTNWPAEFGKISRGKLWSLVMVYLCLQGQAPSYLADHLIPASQALTLLLAAAVYDLPTGTVSLCLAVDSARTAVGLSITPARQSGTRCLMNLEIPTVLIVLNGSRKQFSLAATSVTSALEFF